MHNENRSDSSPNRRGFLKTTGVGIGAGLGLGPASQAAARRLTEKDKLARIASNTWPLRYIFNRGFSPRGGAKVVPTTQEIHFRD